MSSSRSSVDVLSVMVAWMRTRPCSIRSPSSTRVTPIGILVRADTSATERRSQTSRTWAADGESTGASAPAWSRSVASMASSTLAAVRPAVRV